MKQRENAYEPPSTWTVVAWLVAIWFVVDAIGGPWWLRGLLGFAFWFVLHAGRAAFRGFRKGLRGEPVEPGMEGPGPLPESMVDSPTVDSEPLDDLCLHEVMVDSVPYWCGALLGHDGPHAYERQPEMAVSSLEEFERLYGPPPGLGR